MNRTRRNWTLAAILAILAPPAMAQNAPPVPPRPPAPDCTTGPSTEIDFWLGTWKVSWHASGEAYGVNHFTKEIGGCAVYESFQARSRKGVEYLGTSLSFWDPSDHQWHQFYVDNKGRRSVYAGSMQNGDWVMIAPSVSPDRGPYLQRMIVRRNPDGSVRQLGAISSDQGRTWQDIFDLDYVRQ